jgi:hypothetical protein
VSDANWLWAQLDRAIKEVESWDSWKRDVMRREATANAVGNDSRRADRVPILGDRLRARYEKEADAF